MGTWVAELSVLVQYTSIKKVTSKHYGWLVITTLIRIWKVSILIPLNKAHSPNFNEKTGLSSFIWLEIILICIIWYKFIK